MERGIVGATRAEKPREGLDDEVMHRVCDKKRKEAGRKVA